MLEGYGTQRRVGIEPIPARPATEQRSNQPLLWAVADAAPRRETMLRWNPRLIRVRPNAAKIATRLHAVFTIRVSIRNSSGTRSAHVW